jgi:Domain of unknown function (DUF4214)
MSRSESRFSRPRLESLEDRWVPANVGTATQNFVDQVYRDVLHRAPDAAGLAAWSAAIDSSQLSRQEVVLNIQGSEEGLRTQVNDLYLRFLGRSADPTGLAGWTTFLRSRDNDTVELEEQLIASQEYFQTQGGGTDTGFITAVYQDVLGRTPSGAEIAAWQNAFGGTLDAGERLDLAKGVLESVEGRRVEVNNTYVSFLRRQGDAGGINFWSSQLLTDSLDENVNRARTPDSVELDDDVILVADILASPEYFQLAQTLTTTSFATIPGTPPVPPF